MMVLDVVYDAFQMELEEQEETGLYYPKIAGKRGCSDRKSESLSALEAVAIIVLFFALITWILDL